MPHIMTATSRKALVIFSLLIATLTSSVGFSEIYKSKDEKGNIIFSDQPSPDADIVELPEPNTTAPVTVPPKPVNGESEEEEGFESYQLSITKPADGTLIPNGLIGFTVSARISPALKEGHKLQLLINGKEHSRNTRTQIEVASIPRGKHRLQLVALNEKGEKIGSSAAISINALRPSSSN